MNELLQEIIEQEQERMYCVYCYQPKESYSCCQENHFHEFKYFDDKTQQEIAKEILDVQS